jgi:hypothetical protein
VKAWCALAGTIKQAPNSSLPSPCRRIFAACSVLSNSKGDVSPEQAKPAPGKRRHQGTEEKKNTSNRRCANNNRPQDSKPGVERPLRIGVAPIKALTQSTRPAPRPPQNRVQLVRCKQQGSGRAPRPGGAQSGSGVRSGGAGRGGGTRATRRGADTRYWWGGDINQGGQIWTNSNGCGGEWNGKQTAPNRSLSIAFQKKILAFLVAEGYLIQRVAKTTSQHHFLAGHTQL